MARIRSLKPEFWLDRPFVRRVPNRDARMLYEALWNLADEHGRLGGDPHYIKGQTFPYEEDADLTPEVIDALLGMLADARKVVRYEVDGDPYLFLPNLAKHQRLEAAKVPSRLPPPPDPHEPARRADKSAPDPDGVAPRTDGPAPTAENPESGTKVQVTPGSQVRADLSVRDSDESAPRADQSALLYVAGSREQVAGIPTAPPLFDPPPSEVPAAAPPADEHDQAAADETTAGTLIAEWLEHRGADRPSGRIIGRVGKELKALLGEGIRLDDVRQGFIDWDRKGADPASMASFVNGATARRRADLAPTARPGAYGGNVVAIRPSTADQRVAQAHAVGDRLQALYDAGELHL